MALKPCPECGKEVSEGAYSCPNCGKPLQENLAQAALGFRNATGIWTLIFMGGIGIIAIIWKALTTGFH
jgi:hypothetical protein